MKWTKEDVDFSHCSKAVQIALLATLEPMFIMCMSLTAPQMQEYLNELKRVVSKAIEIGDGAKMQ